MIDLTVALISEDVSFRETVRSYLGSVGYIVSAFDNSLDFYLLMNSKTINLVIVDLDLRSEDGLEIVKYSSGLHKIPIIIVSAERIHVIDKVSGLELGADDFIEKPLRLDELVAKMKVSLRSQIPPEVIKRGRVYKFNGWSFSEENRGLINSTGKYVELTSIEYQILIAFVNRPRQTLSRSQLAQTVSFAGIEIATRTVDVIVLRLRRKLGEGALEPIIQTERGIGYTFRSNVSLSLSVCPRVALKAKG